MTGTMHNSTQWQSGAYQASLTKQSNAIKCNQAPIKPHSRSNRVQSSAIRRLSSLTHEAIKCNQVQSGANQASLTKQSRGEAREIAGDAREMRTWPEPRMRDDSMKSSSPPAGVQASPRAIPGRVNSSFASLSYFRGPSNRPSSSRGTCEHGHKAGVHAAGCGEYRDWVQGRR